MGRDSAGTCRQYPSRPCPDDSPGTIIQAEAAGAISEIINVLQEHGRYEAADFLLNLT